MGIGCRKETHQLVLLSSLVVSREPLRPSRRGDMEPLGLYEGSLMLSTVTQLSTGPPLSNCTTTTTPLSLPKATSVLRPFVRILSQEYLACVLYRSTGLRV